jgi:hypothetical protein
MYVFPNLTKKSASFTRLRAKGAFLVSADYDGEAVSNLRILSEKGQDLTLKNPWKGKKVAIIDETTGRKIMGGDFIKIKTKAGHTYKFAWNKEPKKR